MHPPLDLRRQVLSVAEDMHQVQAGYVQGSGWPQRPRGCWRNRQGRVAHSPSWGSSTKGLLLAQTTDLVPQKQRLWKVSLAPPFST